MSVENGQVGRGYEAMMELSQLAASFAKEADGLITKAADLILNCLNSGNKILVCGNGGSAADAQHFAGEFIGRFYKERKSLPVIALNTDTSIITALGNDYGFESIFSRQVEGLGQPGDVLVAMSTSGKSPNILEAIEVAKAKGLKIIALVGQNKNSDLEKCDLCFNVPSTDTPRIQEIHTSILHSICEQVEKNLINY